MDAIVIITWMGIGFLGLVAIFCAVIDFMVDLHEGRRALDKKCADRKQAVEELLEIKRSRL